MTETRAQRVARLAAEHEEYMREMSVVEDEPPCSDSAELGRRNAQPVKVDLTDDKEITPQLVAEVRAAMGEERRQGERRRAEARDGLWVVSEFERRDRAARRAIDRMAAVRPGEIERIRQHEQAEQMDEDYSSWTD